MIPLAAQRGGGLTWEYYFHFDGGSPPWTSAMSQATGLEALTRAYQATGNADYLTVGTPGAADLQRPAAGRRQRQGARRDALPAVHVRPHHRHHQRVPADADRPLRLRPGRATTRPRPPLFAAGNAQAQAELPSFDTGAWSLYQPGVEDTLSYHELVTGFLQQLCTRTQAPVYCTTAQHFQAYETTPPVLTQLTTRARNRGAFALRFRLSKISHVGITVTNSADRPCSRPAPRSATGRAASPSRGSRRPGTYGGGPHRDRPGRQLRADHREPADHALSARARPSGAAA